MGESAKHASARKAGETAPVERQQSLAPRQGAGPPSILPGQSEAEAGRKGPDQDMDGQDAKDVKPDRVGLSRWW